MGQKSRGFFFFPKGNEIVCSRPCFTNALKKCIATTWLQVVSKSGQSLEILQRGCDNDSFKNALKCFDFFFCHHGCYIFNNKNSILSKSVTSITTKQCNTTPPSPPHPHPSPARVNTDPPALELIRYKVWNPVFWEFYNNNNNNNSSKS